MGGKGFPPSGRSTNRNRNETRSTIRSDGKLGGYPLPAGALGTDDADELIEWHPQTVRWWEAWRRSPQATRMVTEPDWDYLLDTALLHHLTWTSGGRNSERVAEIRLRVAQFGATPADRARLRYEIDVPTDMAPLEATGTHATVTAFRSRRDRLTTTD